MLLFRRLGRADMDSIVGIQLDRVRKLMEGRHISLEIADDARAWLAEAGFDPSYGARPLKRVIQRTIQDRIATLLLQGDLRDGDTVVAGSDGDSLELWPRGHDEAGSGRPRENP
jgi:ATP-dependent Clp protease ATP-binding subunit ClpB